MIAGGLNPGIRGVVAPMPLTGGDLQDIPLPQLGQFAQQDQNPALKAAAMDEIARRGASASGWAGAMMPGLSSVSTGAVTAPGQLPPVVPQETPTNPAIDVITTGAATANATADRIPSYVDQNVPSSGAAANAGAGDINPAVAAAQVPSTIGNLIKDIPTDLTPQDKWLALAKGFSALAASRQPGLLGAIGEGAGVAADALRQDQDQAMRNRLFNVEAGQRQQGFEETARSNRVQEGQGADRVALARATLEQAQQQFQFEKQKYEHGIGSETALKLAQIQAQQAQTAFLQAQTEASRASAGTIVDTPEGAVQVVGSQAIPITGPNGKPITRTYKPTAADSKFQMLTGAGIPEQEAALIVSGQKAPTATQIENAASTSARNAAAGFYGPQAQQIYADTYDRVKKELSGMSPAAPSGTGAAPTPQAAPQAGATPPKAAIDMLLADPSLKDQFDQKYGAGSAAKYLGQ